jgi:hypothetical protein
LAGIFLAGKQNRTKGKERKMENANEVTRPTSSKPPRKKKENCSRIGI